MEVKSQKKYSDGLGFSDGLTFLYAASQCLAIIGLITLPKPPNLNLFKKGPFQDQIGPNVDQFL